MRPLPPASLLAAAALALTGCATAGGTEAPLASPAALPAVAAAGAPVGQEPSSQSPPSEPPSEAQARPVLGLMGTIPIYWGESAGVEDLLGDESEGHWARARLEARFDLRPLATLTEENLAGLDSLLLAQPRGLTPAENVALDAWVRDGGRLLLFADPMLTGHSRFGIGDRRRPQDVILLSPILDRWGLNLQFDSDQQPGTATREIAGQAVPVNLAGRFAPPVQGDCTTQAEDVLAVCTIGEGRAVVLADAALLDLHEPDPRAAPALDALVQEAFGPAREIAGEGPETPADEPVAGRDPGEEPDDGSARSPP